MDDNQPDISIDGFGSRNQKSRSRQNGARRANSSNPSGQRRGREHSENMTTQRFERKSFIESFVDFFTSTRTRLGIGVALSLITIVILIILVSYLKNGAVDQSLVTENSVSQIANSPENVKNAGGAAGAKLAHYLFVDGLGVGSFIIAFYTGALALALFGVIRLKFWSFTFKCMFTAIAISIIIGLFTYNSASAIHWGGNHGRYVNQWLYKYSDGIVAYCVTFFLIGLLAVMYLNQLIIIYKNASGTIAKTREAMIQAASRGRETPVRLTKITDDEPEIPSQKHHTEHFNGFFIDDEPESEKKEEKRESLKENNSEKTKPAALDILQIDSDESDSHEPEFNIVNGAPSDGNNSINFGEITENSDFKPYDIRDELSRYRFPTPSLLIERPMKVSVDEEEQESNKDMIVNTLKSYDIPISKIEATIGPTVTRYEIVPAEGIRIAQIKRLEDDIALSLAALGIRIIAPIPGKRTIGIEVPNREPQTVSMLSVINSRKFRETNMALPMALGVTINNDVFIADLAKMPHLLVAGGTGQGKSVGLNCIITSLLYKKHPGELKFVLVDPKQLEFSLYSKLENHFLAKLPDEEEAIVTDSSKAILTLSSLCVEMDNRYNLLKTANVKNIEEYNAKFTSRRLNPEKGHKFMPYLVVIVDEFADLIATAGKDVLVYIGRIAAKARAAGIHMIIATQRPSTDVITGVIKSNFLGRIAFRVMQMVDSKTILDRPGANRLIGRGDMLFAHNATMERVQCAFIDTIEVEAIVDFIDSQIGYSSAYILPEPEKEGGAVLPGAVDLSKRDDMFDDCARFVVQNSTASTSSLQRRFSIGYNKAGKIMDQLEAAGIVGPADGQKPRAVLVDHIQLENIIKGL